MGPTSTRRDGDPDDGHREPCADHQRERENPDIQEPQRPTEPTDFGPSDADGEGPLMAELKTISRVAIDADDRGLRRLG